MATSRTIPRHSDALSPSLRCSPQGQYTSLKMRRLSSTASYEKRRSLCPKASAGPHTGSRWKVCSHSFPRTPQRCRRRTQRGSRQRRRSYQVSCLCSATLSYASRSRQGGKQTQQQPLLVKQTLSRELNLYYSRLTSSLNPQTSDQSKRTAALASLRHDAGLSPLLPYLAQWVSEGVVTTLRTGSQTENDGKMLEVFLDVISALLDNQTLGVEPFVRFLSSLRA